MGDRSIKRHFGLTGTWLHIWLMICNSFSMLLFGYDQGVFGGILAIPSFESRFGLKGQETRNGLVVAIYDLGCLIGAVSAFPIGGRIGRQRSILLGTTIMIIGAFLQFLAKDLGTMIAGRVISGVGNGINTATAPVWVTETAKTKYRGKAGMLLMVINIGGLAISCWMTYAFSMMKSELSWRFPLGFQLFFGISILLTAFWLPESPRWLISKFRDEEAKDVMAALQGGRATRESAIVVREFEEIKQAIDLERAVDGHGKREDMPRFRLILGIGAQAMQQLTGINIICYYLPYVLEGSVGLSGSMARLLSAINAMTYMCFVILGLGLIDKLGRRRLLIIGAAGQCLCWLAITILLHEAGKANESIASSGLAVRLGATAVFFFYLFNCAFGFGWQGTSWLYPTEINSTKHRIQGMSLGVATNWLINFVVVFITPIGIAKLGAFFYVIWCVLNAVMIPILYIFYPETSGRSLEQIDDMFEAHNTIFVCHDKSMISRKGPGLGLEKDGEHGYGTQMDDRIASSRNGFPNNNVFNRRIPADGLNQIRETPSGVAVEERSTASKSPELPVIHGQSNPELPDFESRPEATTGIVEGYEMTQTDTLSQVQSGNTVAEMPSEALSTKPLL